ncbi:DUF3887 domain-containing protein [Aquimarina algicola]|uniref:DUF3887 domain-containing protein n=1 Tax=Aquimarina algicola TaxID=2589995 RepID=A0A504J621_9FLAO|nr:DUF3887 domain-containing protein [Aquimarina algicola]TPN82130.1 DUF3887 domain-containing protein [Aquimarina algicola]
MKHIILLFVCFTTNIILAQDKAAYDNAVKTFQENFNAQNVDAIFDLYTTEMQENMTKEGVTRFVTGCYKQFGSLKSFEFIETTEGISSYTANFDKISLVMELLLSPDNKIATIQFQEP